MNKSWLKMHHFLTQIKNDRRGGVAVMMALMLPVFFGFIGLGVEVQAWFENKRDIQTIADAAALSGAYEARRPNATAATILASATIGANYNDYVVTTDTLVTENPPLLGAYALVTEVTAVEATVTRTVAPLFASLFLDDDITIRARAVARTSDVSDEAESCLVSLAPTGAGIKVTGSGNVDFTDCTISANSVDLISLTVAGAGQLFIDCYSVAGFITATEGLNTAADCRGRTESMAVPDPFAYLTSPTYVAGTPVVSDISADNEYTCDEAGGFSYNSNGNTTEIGFDPDGDDGITDTADDNPFNRVYGICGDFNVTNGTVVMHPGIYVIEGDFSAGAGAIISGDGVSIILKNGGQLTQINGGATINVKNPDIVDIAADSTVGEWLGVLFYQDRDDAAICTSNCNKLSGSSSSTYEGAISFPRQQIEMLGGNANNSGCLKIIAYSILFSGNNDIYGNLNQCITSGTPSTNLPGNVGLVE